MDLLRIILASGVLLAILVWNTKEVQAQSSDNVMLSSTSLAPLEEEDYYYEEDEDDIDTIVSPDVTSSTTSTTAKEKTLTFLKELRNITREAGDFLRLRCEVSGTVPATNIEWFKNDGPLDPEKNRLKIKTSLEGNVQWSQLKFKTLETLDTAFYECRASNGIDTIKSIGILTVNFGKVNFRNNQNKFDQDDNENVGLLPETYSDPAFPGMDSIEFEGGQRPSNMGNDNRNNNNDWFGGGGGGSRRGGNKNKNSKSSSNNLRGLGDSIPNLKPNARAGTCQPYVGSVCAKYVGQEYVFITEGLTQQHIEQKLTAALRVITASPDLSESCSHYAIPSICLSTLPLCDRRTERPREMCREECEMLEDQLCRKELAIARQHALVGTQMVLPVCTELPPVGSPGASTCVPIGIPQVITFDCK